MSHSQQINEFFQNQSKAIGDPILFFPNICQKKLLEKSIKMRSSSERPSAFDKPLGHLLLAVSQLVSLPLFAVYFLFQIALRLTQLVVLAIDKLVSSVSQLVEPQKTYSC